MFGGSKPSFGSTTPGTGFGAFNSGNTTTSPFGQSAFGKPTSAFGTAPTFGGQQPTPSLFGTTATQPQGTGLFGTTSTSSAFGATTAAQPAFGGFAQPQQNTSIFGAAQPVANTNSLFGQSTNSAFGSAVKPGGLGGFGQAGAQSTQSLFGQSAPATSGTAFGSFGQAAPTTTNVFGNTGGSAFGQPGTVAGAANAGSSIAKYQPTIGTDTLMKGGQPNNVNTKQHCITAMKDYEAKSLEELRMEDYLANRKGPQAGTSAAGGSFFGGGTTQPTPTVGLFGNSNQQTTGLFGQTTANAPGTENKGLFGSSAFGQQTTSAFGAASQQQSSFLSKPFGSTNTGGAFGTTATDGSNNPFGAKTAFGQATQPSMFGQAPQANAAPAFGQQVNTGFGGFGTNATAQQPSLFGNSAATDASKSAFGLGAASAANTGFGGFGTTTTGAANTGLFGAKPATAFGATTAFGSTAPANTGFTNFSLGNAGAGSLFNTNKPATSFGGFGTQPAAAPLNFNAGGAGNNTMFGNAGAAKPPSLFGNSLGMGGATNNQNTGGLFGAGGAGFGTNNALGGGFGTLGGFGTAANNTMGGGMGIGAGQQQHQLPIHQQILSKVTSPYGDNPIFKDLRRNDECDAARATNPAAQQAILESTSGQFKVTAKPSPSSIKIKPVGSGTTKKSLFEGLEEFDSTVEAFTLKPNAKRLIIKPRISGGNVNAGQSMTPTSGQADGSFGAGAANRNNSFNGEIPLEQMSPSKLRTADGNGSGNNDANRRESWLHPHNLEKVRQHNLNAGGGSLHQQLNTTLSELVPRKPLDTYRSPTPNMLNAAENPFEEHALSPQTGSETRRAAAAGVTFMANSSGGNKSLSSSRSFGGVEERSAAEDQQPALGEDFEEHPTGIRLRRIGYYTIPSLDDLKSHLAEDGSCVVPNFTVGREGYGNVFFSKELDVSLLNLDEIVHFRNKEVIIYPDDDNKPPVGSGLNREAQVTLDQVWPHDKTNHMPIKDPQRLAEIEWEAKLRRVCDKNDTRFIEYRPETGSWVFRVKHFSKYGLNDSDEEDDDMPTDPKKPKIGAVQPPQASDKMKLGALKNAQQISEDGARALGSNVVAAEAHGFQQLDESAADYMLMDKSNFFQVANINNSDIQVLFDGQRKFNHGHHYNSPTAALAKDVLGTDSHKLQLMKASFFIDDDEDDDYDGGAAKSTQLRSALGGRISIAPSPSALNALAFAREPATEARGAGSSAASSVSHYESSALMSVTLPASAAVTKHLQPFIVRPKIAPARGRLVVQVPFSQSLAFEFRGGWAADAGIFNSRRFKLGFGPQMTLIVPTTLNNVRRDIKNENLADVAADIFRVRDDNDYSATVLQHIQIASTQHCEHFRESIVPQLQTQLRYSLQEDVAGSDCPWIHSDKGAALIAHHLDEAIAQIQLGSPRAEYDVSVWSLCLTLWGDHDELEDREPTSHYAIMCRRQLLSEWLENTLTDEDMLARTVSSHTYLDHLLELVMCHKVSQACELAFNYDDANLALLLAQLSSGPAIRLLMEDQLASWHKAKADKFIQLERIKLCMLVAGVALMESAHGAINLLEGINWIKVFATQLWYLSSPTASITDVLLAYNKSFQSEEYYTKPPEPSYCDNSTASVRHRPESQELYDLRYHLLQLYSKRSHPMESLLNPATHTNDPMDYRLSWLLLQTLEALGYHHCGELNENQLHVGFAAQLENHNEWEWAVFVLLHIKQRGQRELAVQHVLYRYVSVSKDVALTDQEKFVINNLGVPEKWIDYAKAVKAGAIGDHHMQAKYLLKAKQWTLAHDVIYQHIAPDAVINDNLNYLHDLLRQFECADLQKSARVPNWSNQGQIFLDFIEINEKFNSLKSLKTEADIEARWENLKPQLAELCSRINLLPCPTTKHRLCQSEIAQNLACLVRGVLLVCPGLNPCLIIKIALERLPLPQEFAQQELRALLDALVGELSKKGVSVDVGNRNETTV